MLTLSEADPGLVDLSRRYEPVALDQEDLETISARSMIALFDSREHGLSIEDLVSKPLTVVLGEARSGKTTEFRLAAERLRHGGLAAFFIRIEDLAHGAGTDPEALRAALDMDSETAFDAWLKSNEEAVYFLDSVDEAKLQHVGDYRRAIRSFQVALRQHLHRVRLVLSCRVTEWRPKDDVGPLNALKPYLVRPSNDDSTTEDDAPIQLVQIMPLDQHKIEQLALHQGMENTGAFIDAIKKTDALEYAGRPGDAIEIIELWIQRGRLGTLTEIVEHNIYRKLKEEAEIYKGVLSNKKARDGAEILAATSVLCAEASFRFTPLEQDPIGALPALDPSVILPDWNPEELRAILRRPIFDEATYGRVRFHTRTVREYLAASWFQKKHKAGCPNSEIVGIFFSTKYGGTAAIPSRTSVAAWLAPHVPELLEHILAHNPEILPDEGDPQALPVAIRSRVLKKLVQRYADRSRTGYQFDRQGLRRFAHRDLAKTITHLLTVSGVADDTRSLLLDLVEVGKITECVETALRIALDAEAPSELRVDAILALRECGANEELKQVLTALKATPKVSDRLYGWALYAAYPQIIGANELLELLSTISSQVVTVTHYIKDMAQQATDEEKDPERLAILAPALLRLVETSPPVEDQETSPYRWLFGCLCNVVINWLEATTTDPDWLYDAIDFIKVQKDSGYHASQAKKRIGELLAKAPASIREKIFWRRHKAYMTRNNSGNIHYFQFLGYYEVWKLIPSDIDWLLERVQAETNSERRFTAFDAALSLCSQDSDQGNRMRELQKAATPFPALSKHFIRHTTPRQPTLTEITFSLSVWARDLRQKWESVKSKETIIGDLPNIAAGEKSEYLLCTMFHDVKRPNGVYSEQDVWSLVPVYGKRGTEAFRAGLIRFWPTWEPKENPRLGDNLALLGVACAVEDGLDLASLEKPFVERLTKLAFKEINLPDWFSSLVRYHKGTVSDIVLVWLDDELTRKYENGVIPRVLMYISHAHPTVRDSFAQQIFEIEYGKMPLDMAARRYVVRILDGGAYRHLLGSLAGGYLATKNSLTAEDVFWLAIWLQVSATDALSYLERYLQKTDQVKADQMVQLLATLLDRNHNGDAIVAGNPDYISVTTLRRLVPLLYSYVRPTDDKIHYKQWTPDDRDNAESFRGRLVADLAGIPGEQAYRALLEVRDAISNQPTKDWIARKADERIGLDGDIPWRPSDVLEFEKNHEHDPRTVDDLFNIGVKRLIEIRDQFEKGDYSLRKLFTLEIHENLLQKHIAQRLRELSRGRYSEVREPEVDNQKEPDIRLLLPNLSPVSIEVKWAHKRSLVELKNDLSDQLVDRYLKSEDSSHGIFVIVNAVHNHTWSKRGMKKKYKFDDLTKHLSKIAKSIECSKPGVSQLKVIGMDLTK